MKRETLFEKYRNLLDSIEVGETITRQTAIYKLDPDSRGNSASVDKYRRMFEKANFLRYRDLGMYDKIRNLPKNLTSKDLERENEKFLIALNILPSWNRKTIEEAKREDKWRNLS